MLYAWLDPRLDHIERQNDLCGIGVGQQGQWLTVFVSPTWESRVHQSGAGRPWAGATFYNYICQVSRTTWLARKPAVGRSSRLEELGER